MAEYDFLNSPDFGAFGGLKAREASELHGAQTLRIMGEIAGQPGERDLKAAQTRHHNAQAALDEEKAAEARAWNAPGGEGAASAGDPMENLENFFLGKFQKNPIKALEGLGKLSTIRTQQQQQNTAAATEEWNTSRAELNRTRMLGGAAGAAMASPQAFQNFMLRAPAAGFNIAGMPQDYESAKPWLEQVANEALTRAEQLRARAEGAAQATRQQQANTAAARAGTAARVATKRIELINQEITIKKKDGGQGQAAITDLRRERSRLAAIRSEAELAGRELKPREKAGDVPIPAPPNPVMRRLQQVYMTPRGPLVWLGNGKWGQPGGTAAAAAAGGGIPAVPGMDLGDDDEDDD